MKQRYELVEFRNYQITEGHVPEFRDHFEAHYLAPQEVHGMHVLGLFEVVDRPDRIVWVRAYADATQRASGLTAWYEHDPEWLSTRAEANRYLERYDNVLLLRPSAGGPEFAAEHVPHAERGTDDGGDAGFVLAIEYPLTSGQEDLSDEQERGLELVLSERGVRELGRLVTARVENEYPRLPVRDDDVALWLVAGAEQTLRTMASEMSQVIPGATTLLLKPTASSTLR